MLTLAPGTVQIYCKDKRKGIGNCTAIRDETAASEGILS